ncbi:hypothetical protein EGT07_18220 [Herbaspirillum sp. HC18]|nr:hypothetical protein EGT07_18220 [Herbaspirillum sp. HC18]
MKLPQYESRLQPGAALYSSGSSFEDIKMIGGRMEVALMIAGGFIGLLALALISEWLNSRG